jgi:molybdopterin synthase catalytic subunit
MAVIETPLDFAIAAPEPLARGIMRAAVDSAELNVADHEDAVDTPEAGACVSFVGRVRGHDGGRGVLHLEYSAHPRSPAEAHRIASQVLGAYPGVRAIALSHRIGRLQVGEVAIVCAVSAGHRGEAFDACRLLVETVKHELPIWKHQVFFDGTEEWVGTA